MTVFVSIPSSIVFSLQGCALSSDSHLGHSRYQITLGQQSLHSGVLEWEITLEVCGHIVFPFSPSFTYSFDFSFAGFSSEYEYLSHWMADIQFVRRNRWFFHFSPEYYYFVVLSPNSSETRFKFGRIDFIFLAGMICPVSPGASICLIRIAEQEEVGITTENDQGRA